MTGYLQPSTEADAGILKSGGGGHLRSTQKERGGAGGQL